MTSGILALIPGGQRNCGAPQAPRHSTGNRPLCSENQRVVAVFLRVKNSDLVVLGEVSVAAAEEDERLVGVLAG